MDVSDVFWNELNYVLSTFWKEMQFLNVILKDVYIFSMRPT